MRAVVVDQPGGPDVLQLRTVPVPAPRTGWVLIRVMAFGLNRSELHFRQGVASTGSFPRVPGIEATGVVGCRSGRRVRAGHPGRHDDGRDGPRLRRRVRRVRQPYPPLRSSRFRSALPWSTLGAVPEMLQTAYGSLVVGLQAADGQSLLIRGGTSSIGMALAVLAKRREMTVLSTTRKPENAALLERLGVDHVVIDTGPSLRPSATCFPTASTARSSSWVSTSCVTRCGPSDPAARSASPGCFPTSGRSRSSTRWIGCRTGSGSRRTPARRPICPPRRSRTSSTPSPAGRRWCRSVGRTVSTRSSAPTEISRPTPSAGRPSSWFDPGH